MTKTELAYAAAFLHECYERLSNESCNDMFLADTPENREFVQAALDWNSRDPEERQLRTYKGRISTHNSFICHYLRDRLKQEIGGDLPNLHDWPQ